MIFLWVCDGVGVFVLVGFGPSTHVVPCLLLLGGVLDGKNPSLFQFSVSLSGSSLQDYTSLEMPKNAVVSHLKAQTRALLQKAQLELCSQQFYAGALQPKHISHLIVTSIQNPRPPLPGGLRVRPYPLPRHLLWALVIEDTILSQAPNKLLCLLFQWTQGNSCCFCISGQPSPSFAPATAHSPITPVTP